MIPFFLIFSIAFTVLALAMLFRNNEVYHFRTILLNEVTAAAHIDIEEGKSWAWRYKVYGEVEYNQMLFRFWKPLRASAWWDDLAFTNGEDISL